MTLCGKHNRKLRFKLLRHHKCPQLSRMCLMIKFKDWWRIGGCRLQVVSGKIERLNNFLVALDSTFG